MNSILVKFSNENQLSSNYNTRRLIDFIHRAVAYDISNPGPKAKQLIQKFVIQLARRMCRDMFSPNAFSHESLAYLRFVSENFMFSKTISSCPIKLSSCHCNSILELKEILKKSTFCENLEAFVFHADITNKNSEEVLEAFKIMLDKCPNLKSFSCRNIGNPADVGLGFLETDKKAVFIQLPENFNRLTSFSCGDITWNATLILPKNWNNLISFSCGTLHINSTLTFSEECQNLAFISCKDIHAKASIVFPNTLKLINFLAFFLDNLFGNTILTFPKELPNLKYFVFANLICSKIIFPQSLPMLERIDFISKNVSQIAFEDFKNISKIASANQEKLQSMQ